MPKIVVIGESGQLAQSLRALHWPSGFTLALHGRRSLKGNLEADLLRDVLRTEGAHLVVNAAAYTAVDHAESEPQAASALNARLPQTLAAACAELDLPLVHSSTDYVFDGQKGAPYVETDAPNPLSVYGQTKLQGERAIEQAGALRRWAILRASWVVSEVGDTFPVKLLRRARAGEALRVVNDQWGCPTVASDLARAIQEVALRQLDGEGAACGLFHFCGASDMSWYGFAERVLAAAKKTGLKPPPLQAITTAELNAPARRPLYSVLSCARIRQSLGLSAVAIESDLDRMVRSILAR
ncbi:dTDP-4-dehydrorhamnose reductase [Dongia deserti]|uniref:dTDP-4-dehydrorhamnose reductase n=1 Tax=Dongia deserti TaxID=2268030 RepID=UPI000E646205|nr:dTDP-4-dehydrorhamnose reductase [Dongia deserti]